MKSVGNNIKKRRNALGMTQSELADRLGYSGKWSIAKIEAGASDLTIPKIKLFADALMCSIEDLTEGLDEEILREDAFIGIKVMLQKTYTKYGGDFSDLPEDLQNQLIAAAVMAARQYYQNIKNQE